MLKRRVVLTLVKEILFKKVRSIIPILIPLFASSFKRADALAIAMEARGYQGGEGRIKYRRLSWNGRDTLSIIAILSLGLMLFILRVNSLR